MRNIQVHQTITDFQISTLLAPSYLKDIPNENLIKIDSSTYLVRSKTFCRASLQ